MYAFNSDIMCTLIGKLITPKQQKNESNSVVSTVLIQVITQHYVSPTSACASSYAACLAALCHHGPELQVSVYCKM